MNDYFRKVKLEDFSRAEFLMFLSELNDPKGRTEAEDDRWIEHFRILAKHPRGADLLFYPEAGKDSDEAVVEEIERYRRENGLPGFKDTDF